MPRIFFGNFDFEHELARRDAAGVTRAEIFSAASPSKGTSPGSDLFWTWLPVAESDDFLVAPGRIDPGDFGELSDLGLATPHFVHDANDLQAQRGIELVPWGWTGGLAELATAHGWSAVVPPLEVVRRVNSRAFRFALEHEWDVGLAGAAIVDSIDELKGVIEQQGHAPRGWLLKANFGMSGREALRGRGTSLDENARNWAQKRLAAGGSIVYEPIVDRVAETGIQLLIPKSGPPELAGVTPLLVDRRGVYRGSRFGCPASELAEWQPAVDVGERVAQTVQRLGYFGPLGIDAMQFRDPTGTVRLRPLQDINARFTMGRLALGFRRILPPGWCGTWLHFARRHLAGRELDAWLSEFRPTFPTETFIAATSPRTIDARQVEHHAVVVLAETPAHRQQAETAILGSLGIDIQGG